MSSSADEIFDERLFKCKRCMKVKIESKMTDKNKSCKKCHAYQKSICDICNTSGHGINENKEYCSNHWIKCKKCGYCDHEDNFYTEGCLNCGTEP
jgi:hypothetical protein